MRTIYSVTQLTRLIKERLEDSFDVVRVEGEISNARQSGAGHLYFTLKDSDALISAVLFRGRLNGIPFEPRDGQRVIATGAISVYAPRGSYQLICESMEQAGVGRLLQLLEERKRRLAAEGLFDDARKTPLPPFPATVALVTSPTGAAVRDIVNVCRRRNPALRLVIAPTLVQGEQAAATIAAQIERVDRLRLGEVIIVTRGGGSLEDLLPFSDEAVVRAVAAATTPIISAVGHEVDSPLTDFAADYRAPTPSAAAEMVAYNAAAVRETVIQLGRTVVHAAAQRLFSARAIIQRAGGADLRRSLQLLMQPLTLRADEARERLLYAARQKLALLRARLSATKSQLSALSPNATLERGYAIVQRLADGALLTDPAQVTSGDEIAVRSSRYHLTSRVLAIQAPDVGKDADEDRNFNPEGDSNAQ